MRARPRSSAASAITGTSRWPGLVFGCLGVGMSAVGGYLIVDRSVMLFLWPETEARVVESAIRTSGSQHVAEIRVELDLPGGRRTVRPANDYRSKNYGWVASAVERYPVGGTAPVRYDPHHPGRARLDVGANFNTFGTPLLMAAVGLAFWGIGILADRSARLRRAEATASNREEAVRLARGQYVGVASLVGLIGLGSLGGAAALTGPALEVRHWPAVNARTERADIVSRSSYFRRGESVTFYSTRLFLAYEFEGRPYTSAVVLRNSSSNRASIERFTTSIPAGDPFPVRIDPGNPYHAVAADDLTYILPIVFGFAGVVLSGVSILLFRARPKPPPTEEPEDSSA